MENWTPLNDKILIQRIPLKGQVGLLYLPEITNEKSHRGIVIAKGPGKWIEGINGGQVRKPIDVSIGDIVHFSLHDWEAWDDLHLIIEEEDLFLVEKPN